MPVVIFIIECSIVIPEPAELIGVLIWELIAMATSNERSGLENIGGFGKGLISSVTLTNLAVRGAVDCGYDGGAVIHVDGSEPEGLSTGCSTEA